jgi:branched-chain amino acid transport system ATP-binding protein
MPFASTHKCSEIIWGALMLDVQGLSAGYEGTQVLREVSLQVHKGEWVTVLGRNGAGRSTLLKALMGLLPAQGQVTWAGVVLTGQEPHERARAGMAYVPESRDVFNRLTVEQNLLLGVQPVRRAAASLESLWTLERVYEVFPLLAQRRAQWGGVLSGGEQQLLSMARALMGQPQLLLVDEPTEGLSPRWVHEVLAVLQLLKQQGVTLVVVEQKRPEVLPWSDRVVVLGRGQVVYQGKAAALAKAKEIQAEWLEG